MTERYKTIDIPAPADWRERVRGLRVEIGYFEYPEATDQNGWYGDFDLDGTPRYFGPFETQSEAVLFCARDLGMVATGSIA